ncbi:MAG: LptF/LptG family permease [Candidatus Marinimicrobia bacterium]|nr:LptF/LptG family permease [Candidatus Neomarinimicrobiota bacterium]
MAVLGMAIGLILLVHVVERIDNFIDASIPFSVLGMYYYLQIPFFVSLSVPIAFMIAGVVTISSFIRSKEFLISFALGFSLWKIVRSIIITSLILVPIVFWWNETLVIQTQREILKTENQWLKKHRSRFQNRREDLFFRYPPDLAVVIQRYYMNEKKGENLTIQYFHGKEMIKRIDASKFHWDSLHAHWVLNDFTARELDSGKVNHSKGQSMIFSQSDFLPQNVQEQFYQSSELSAWELRRTIHKMETTGLDTTPFRVGWHFKVAFAFAIFILSVLTIPIVILSSRGNMGIGIGISLLVSFMYIVFVNYGQILGKAHVLPPFYAVWIPNFGFIGAGLFLFYRAKK